MMSKFKLFVLAMFFLIIPFYSLSAPLNPNDYKGTDDKSVVRGRMAEVFDKFTDKQLVSILKKHGYEPVQIYKPGLIAFLKNDTLYLIDNGYDNGSLQIFSSFENAEISFISMIDKKIEKWNMENAI